MTAFGQFPSLEAFLIAYEADRRQRQRAQEADLSPAEHVIRRPRDRDVVEVDCNIAEVEPSDTDGLKHVLLQVEVTGIIESDADVDADVQSHLASRAHVLVAIQYGGGHRRSPGAIPGLVAGANIRVRGEWIPAERAYPAGGEKISVLHFTHSPLGFVMVGGTIYR
jgi:endonuclease G